MLHKHHIIPIHAGGQDTPENIVLLTIEKHAEAHDILYQKYGKIEDRLARDGLLGMISKENIIQELCSIAKGSKWYFDPANPSDRKMLHPSDPVPPGWLPGRGLNTWSKNRDYRDISQEHRQKISDSISAKWKNGAFDSRKKSTVTEAVIAGREKNRGKKRKKTQCPYCKNFIPVNTYPRYHGEKCKSKPPQTN